MNEFFRRLGYLWNRSRLDRELAGDLEFHREMAAREGGTRLGNALNIREQARDAWGWTWMERCSQDLRYAARILRKSPGFTVAAVLMLALGIGVNVAVFGFFDLMFLRALPVRDPDTLVRFERRSAESFSYDLPYPEMAFFREHSRTIAAFLALTPSKLAIEGDEKPLKAHFVTANFFSELGAVPKLGRTLDPERDGAPGAEPVVVLSRGFWRRHFGADPAAIGRTIRLNGKPVTVVGVAADEFTGLSLDTPDLWLPIDQQAYLVAGSHLLTELSADGAGVRMWGRLRPGSSPKTAERELALLAAELRKQHPQDLWENETLRSKPGGYATSLMEADRRGSGPEPPDEILPIFGLVASLGLLILAVACGNLGSLLLARGVARQREIAIRVSVGAGQSRLIRQLFTESLLLALLGSGAGLAAGYVVLRSLLQFTEAPAWLNPVPDWRVAVFAAGSGFVAATLFGLTPALQLARQRHRATFLRQLLIGAQVAASCVLLIVASLLVRAIDHAMTTRPGFEYEQVVSIDPALGSHGYSPESASAYFDLLRDRLGNLSGVESVALADTSPLGNRTASARVNVDGRPVEILINRVDPAFLQTMKIPLLRGRNLLRGDTRAIVISESLARRAWPTDDALGKKFTMDGDFNVVGIAGSARLVRPEDPEMVQVYFLAAAAELPSMVVLVKTSAPPESLAPVVASIARAIDPKIYPEIQLLKSSFRQKVQSRERGAVAVSLLGFTALLLACLGIVGLVAYSVAQRTKEIGIRMALGAKPSHVLFVVLRQFSRPVMAGLLVGVGGAAALSQILRRQLYGLNNLDPVTYSAAVAIFLIAVVLAALAPARRALRVDPIGALRCD
jgi:predicted permease